MLYLVDSSIYIFRAWQTLPTSVLNQFGEVDNAVQGFVETLCQLIESKQPELMLCAFDECYRQGIRHRIYPEYKADRPPAPEELAPQFSRCKKAAEALGLTVLGSDLVEADDIIGHFAGLAQVQGLPVTIVSGDKDLAQFVGQQDLYWDIGKREVATYSDIAKRFKVLPEQMADWLALCGDQSDNIPGVPGVGASTAAKLLNKWGDIDTLLANLGEVSMMRFRGAPRVSRLLYENKSAIALARSLTGIINDDRLPRDLNSCKKRVIDSSEITENLVQLGFTSAHANRIAERVVTVTSR